MNKYNNARRIDTMDINGHISLCEDYVSFETAKLLKEKGFHQPVEFFYSFSGKLGGATPYDWNQTRGDFQDYSCITLWMAMKWLREMEWFICIIPLAFYCGEKASKFGYNIWAGDNLEVDEFDTPKFNTYEEAAEAAIKYCLENLI